MLPDLLDHNLGVIFCGTGAGDESARRQEYYAGPGNKFWPTLNRVGLTPRQLRPSEYEQLLSYGVGLTDLVKHKSGTDSVMKGDDFVDGRGMLIENIKKYRPRVVCFNGKKAAKEFFNVRKIDYGLVPLDLDSPKFFVAPSTSGMAAKYWDITRWEELADLVRASRDD